MGSVFRSILSQLTSRIPIGVLVMLILAGFSSIYILFRPSVKEDGLVCWTFATVRAPLYQEIFDALEKEGQPKVKVELIEARALSRRTLSGFFSGTPLADMVEIERAYASSTWRGPLEAVGFLDLTDRLHEEGLYEQINEPSFSPWTSRGRIFGIPNDVHPVLLCYRADIFEAAGIDVEELDTWDKYFAATAPLVKDLTGDGNPDQFVFELQETEGATVSALLTQAGGGYFDDDEKPILNCPINIRVLAKLVDWATGPDKMTGDVEFLSGAGNRLRSEGFVLSWVVPDWRAYYNKLYMGSLKGKVKLMPLPAWEEGGRRTSVWGGTMIGVPKTGKNIEKSWELSKRLYLSHELSMKSWTENGVLTPYKVFWDDPIYREPDPYFSNQPIGLMFIDQAPHVPKRTSSPYFYPAMRELTNALTSLVFYARRNEVENIEELEIKAAEFLQRAQDNVSLMISRNTFLEVSAADPSE